MSVYTPLNPLNMNTSRSTTNYDYYSRKPITSSPLTASAVDFSSPSNRHGINSSPPSSPTFAVERRKGQYKSHGFASSDRRASGVGSGSSAATQRRASRPNSGSSGSRNGGNGASAQALFSGPRSSGSQSSPLFSFSASSSSPITPPRHTDPDPRKAVIRERFEKRCVERMKKSKKQALGRKRFSFPGENPFVRNENDMDDDVEEETEDDIMKNEVCPHNLRRSFGIQ
jgi:hypothetical protein